MRGHTEGFLLTLFLLEIETYYIKDLMNYNFTWVEPIDIDHLNRQLLNQEVCYNDLGCFSLEYPWFSKERPILYLPQSPEIINTEFFLSTREAYGENRIFIETRPEISFNGTCFDPTKWTVFFTHGFQGSADETWVRDLEEAILIQGDVNLITCDWSDGSKLLNYVQVAANTRVVGAEIARMIDYLIKNNLATRNKIHMIGQSLGAHAMSYAAENITSIARITGLDPAQPGFENAHPSTCLDKSDAQFVEIIHTNAESFLPHLGLGIINSVGHVDFFANGGQFQPGCFKNIKEYLAQYITLLDILTSPFKGDYLSCSHRRAYEYYTESLMSNCSFWARKWEVSQEPPLLIPCTPNTCQEMGKHTSLFPTKGSFYIYTNSESPFCISDPISEQSMTEYLNELVKGYNDTELKEIYDV